MELQECISEALHKQVDLLGKLVRPYVIADVYPRRSVNMLYFRIRNVGRTPAYDIRVDVNPPIRFRGRSSSELNIFARSIGVLGPGEEISIFFNSALELFNTDDSILQFEIELEYADSDETRYTTTISIDIDLLRGLAVELPATDKILDELDRIHGKIGEIARYASFMYHRELTKNWREQEEQVEKSPDEENTK